MGRLFIVHIFIHSIFVSISTGCAVVCLFVCFFSSLNFFFSFFGLFVGWPHDVSVRNCSLNHTHKQNNNNISKLCVVYCVAIFIAPKRLLRYLMWQMLALFRISPISLFALTGARFYTNFLCILALIFSTMHICT